MVLNILISLLMLLSRTKNSEVGLGNISKEVLMTKSEVDKP